MCGSRTPVRAGTADQGHVSSDCLQCQAEITDGRGHEAPGGHQLCSPCYFALWGPADAYDLARAVEELPILPRRVTRSPWAA